MLRYHVTVGKSKKMVSAADAKNFPAVVALAFHTGTRGLEIIQSWDEESRDWLDVDSLDEVEAGTKLHFVYSETPMRPRYENPYIVFYHSNIMLDRRLF